MRVQEVRLVWDPRDAWVGVFVDPSPDRLRLFVCLLPCLPIRITLYRSR